MNIKNTIQSLLGIKPVLRERKTVASILSSFRQTIADLQEVAKRDEEEVKSNLIRIEALRLKNNELGAEAAEAKAVASNLSQMLGEGKLPS